MAAIERSETACKRTTGCVKPDGHAGVCTWAALGSGLCKDSKMPRWQCLCDHSDCGGGVCDTSKRQRTQCVLGCDGCGGGVCNTSKRQRSQCVLGCDGCGGGVCDESKRPRSECVLGCDGCGGGVCEETETLRAKCSCEDERCGSQVCPLSHTAYWFCKGGAGHSERCGAGMFVRSIAKRAIGGGDPTRMRDTELVRLLGCTPQEMMWWAEENYKGGPEQCASDRAKGLAQLDHQKPVHEGVVEAQKAEVKLGDKDEKAEAISLDIAHWSNMAYLSTRLNQLKSAKYPAEFAARLEEKRRICRAAFAKGGMTAAIKQLREWQAAGDEKGFALLPEGLV